MLFQTKAWTFKAMTLILKRCVHLTSISEQDCLVLYSCNDTCILARIGLGSRILYILLLHIFIMFIWMKVHPIPNVIFASSRFDQLKCSKLSFPFSRVTVLSVRPAIYRIFSADELHVNPLNHHMIVDHDVFFSRFLIRLKSTLKQ